MKKLGKVINQDLFLEGLFELLSETFETHHGMYLDRGTSLFETLDRISATEASQPVGGKCATLAAQFTHVNFYLEVLEKYIHNQETGNIDWTEIWQTVQSVTSKEWDYLRKKLKRTYQRLIGEMRKKEDWNNTNAISGSMAIIVHSAYHLGEIRQALCTLKK